MNGVEELVLATDHAVVQSFAPLFNISGWALPLLLLIFEILLNLVLARNVFLLSRLVHVGVLSEQNIRALIFNKNHKIQVPALLNQSQRLRIMSAFFIIIRNKRNHLTIRWHYRRAQRGGLIEIQFVFHAFQINIHSPVIMEYITGQLVITALDRDADHLFSLFFKNEGAINAQLRIHSCGQDGLEG